MSPACFGLPVVALEGIGAVLARHPKVASAVLYGSRAKGNYRNGSDVDLTLHGEGLGYRDLLEIADELDDLLLPYTIDLSVFALLTHPELRAHIERVGQEFYRRSQATEKPLAGSRA